MIRSNYSLFLWVIMDRKERRLNKYRENAKLGEEIGLGQCSTYATILLILTMVSRAFITFSASVSRGNLLLCIYTFTV